MAPINLHGPLNGTHSLKGADSLNRLGSICMKPIHYSLSTTSPYEWYSLFNGFTDSEEEVFFDLFPYLWCQFFSEKCV